jgi:hypothetical protein
MRKESRNVSNGSSIVYKIEFDITKMVIYITFYIHYVFVLLDVANVLHGPFSIARGLSHRFVLLLPAPPITYDSCHDNTNHCVLHHAFLHHFLLAFLPTLPNLHALHALHTLPNFNLLHQQHPVYTSIASHTSSRSWTGAHTNAKMQVPASSSSFRSTKIQTSVEITWKRCGRRKRSGG